MLVSSCNSEVEVGTIFSTICCRICVKNYRTSYKIYTICKGTVSQYNFKQFHCNADSEKKHP